MSVKFNQNKKPFIHEIVFKDIVCEMMIIFSRGDELKIHNLPYLNFPSAGLVYIRESNFASLCLQVP